MHSLTHKSIALADGSHFIVHNVVREVPNQRVVCSGEWVAVDGHSEDVFAKLFFGKKSLSHAMRDANGIKALQQSNIPTPVLLLSTQAPALMADVLLIQAHHKAQNFETLMQGANASRRLALATKVVETLAMHHKANLIQTDLYFKNFLLDGDEVLTIDGDGIRKYASLTDAKASQNLSVLISKLDVLDVEENLPKLLASYKTKNSKLNLSQVKQQSKSHRIKVTNSYAESKVFRQCTDVNVERGANSFRAVSSRFSEVPTLGALDDLITQDNLLKNGNTCTVALINLADTRAVVKRYNIKNTAHKLSRLLRPTRASTSWANAYRLHLLEIPTPAPIALIEERQFCLRGKAYFLSEYVDAPDIAAYLKTTTNSTDRAAFVKETVQLFYRLYLLNISHGDMKSTNIIVFKKKPMLIDLDSMKQHHSAFFAQKSHIKDLKRFMRNWKHDASLYNAFLKTFKVVYLDHQVLRKANLI